MKNLLKYINILILSIIYLLGSGVFFHTIAMEDDMKTPMECCEFHNTSSSKTINSQQSSHCLGYEDTKLTNTSYSNYKISNSISIYHKSLDVNSNILSENISLYKFSSNHIHTTYDQKFLQFSDLIGIIILLC